MTLDEAYARLGLRPILEFESEALERQRAVDPELAQGRRRIGTTFQVMIECLIDLIDYESSPAYPQMMFQANRPPTRREDDFVIVMGPGAEKSALNGQNSLASEFYKKLGGRHAVDRYEGPPNLWLVLWDQKSRSLRGSSLAATRFFFDPWSAVDAVPHGPVRYIRSVDPKPVMKAADGSWVYEAVDRGLRRVALVTTQQAQSVATWSLTPTKIGANWVRPRGTHP